MFNELKKDYLEVLKEQLISLQKEQENIDMECKSLNETIINLGGNILHDERYIQFENNYSKIAKIFNRGKYNKEKQQLFAEIRENRNKMHEECQQKRDGLYNRKQEIYKEIDNVKKQVQEIASVNNLDGLNLSFDKAKEILSQKGINILDYSNAEIFQLGPSFETNGNIEFMKRAINENPFNIIYDRTNNYEMYRDLINGLDYQPNTQNETEMQKKQFFDYDKTKILSFLEQFKNNSSHIELTQMLEVIRFYFKDNIMYEKGNLREGNIDDIVSAFSNIRTVVEKALELSKEDYLTLEGMYNPSENDYYCHRTGTKGVKEAIFKNGLKVSSQGTGERLIVKNARKVDCFLAIAGYQNFYAGNGAGESRIILEIPKKTEWPIGSDQRDGKDSYVLPEFVMASLDDENNKSKLYINSHQNQKTYQYLYRDGYNLEAPFPIENPLFSNEDSKGIGR